MLGGFLFREPHPLTSEPNEYWHIPCRVEECMTELWSIEQAHRIEKFQRDYFATPPDNITQLAVDAMIIVIALKTSLREVERQTEARVRAETWEAAAQIADGWAKSPSCHFHDDHPCLPCQNWCRHCREVARSRAEGAELDERKPL